MSGYFSTNDDNRTTVVFILIFYGTHIHSITFIQYIHPSPFAEVPLHLLIAGHLSGKNLLGVPSRESNSGLPYSKPTHFSSHEDQGSMYPAQLKGQLLLRLSKLPIPSNVLSQLVRLEGGADC